MEQVKQAAIKALIYADIFNYPLTSTQMWEYAVASDPFSFEQLRKTLPLLKKKIYNIGDVYYLTGRERLVPLRTERAEISRKKLLKAQQISRVLSFIPTIFFIGVSGSVSMGNADMQDDIDLFFITAPGSVWVSRLFVSFLLQLFGVRRRKYAQKVSDKVCANMFIDKNAISFPQERQNLYTAHEVAQTIPLFSIGNTYDEFITKNAWIYAFLPNWEKREIRISPQTSLRAIMVWMSSLPEWVVRVVQIAYMEKSKTTEVVTKNIIAFYPGDRYKTVMGKFVKGCKAYDL